MKLQQKIIFTTQEYKLNTDTMQNESIETILFQDWADIRNAKPIDVLNGTQLAEIDYTHTAIIRFNMMIDNKMNCHRNIRLPDRSIVRQNFIVVSYELYQQENRFMLLKLSEVTDGY